MVSVVMRVLLSDICMDTSLSRFLILALPSGPMSTFSLKCGSTACI